MSEFGNESATATMRVTEKTLDNLLKLLKFIMERNDRKLNNKMKKEQIRQLKNAEDKDYINKKRGYVRTKKLLNSGEKLIPISTALSPDELTRFNKLAKLEGVAYTAISDQALVQKAKAIKSEINELDTIAHTGGITKEQLSKKKELENQLNEIQKQRQNKIIIIRAKDLELVKEITERMNMEIKLSNVNQQITDLESKEVLNDEEKQKLSELTRQKEHLEKNEFTPFNEKNNKSILNNSIDNSVPLNLSFDKAINRVTDREYAEKPCYICDRNNPKNYIEVTSVKDEYKGRQFTNTEYRVFNNDKEQRSSEFSHGKFTHYSKADGENTTAYGDNHWSRMKKEIKEKGNLTDDVLVFGDKDTYLKYREEYEKQNSNENALQKQDTVRPIHREDTIGYEADDNSYKDYMGIVNKLNSQLSDHNLTLNQQGEVCNRETGKTISLRKNMMDDEYLEYAQAINLGKQINIYMELNNKQTELAFARQQDIINETDFENEGRPDNLKELYEKMKEQIQGRIQSYQSEMAVLEKKITELQSEQKDLYSINLLNSLLNKTEKNQKSKESQANSKKENTHREEKHTQSRASWNKDVRTHNTEKAAFTNGREKATTVINDEKEV